MSRGVLKNKRPLSNKRPLPNKRPPPQVKQRNLLFNKKNNKSIIKKQNIIFVNILKICNTFFFFNTCLFEIRSTISCLLFGPLFAENVKSLDADGSVRLEAYNIAIP
jgi:hypothetical protein